MSAPPRRLPPRGAQVDPHVVGEALAHPGARVVVTAHRNADGDALGSMLGLARALRGCGADVVLAHPDPSPVPEELSFLLRPGEEEIAAELPDDVGERTLVALDCSSEDRLWDDQRQRRAGRLVNLDHHADNSRFGDLNLVEPAASSTAEVVVHVLEAAGLALSPEVAEPLYVGLVTDTGRFGYDNTSPEAHRVAGLLIAAGADPSELSQRLWRDLPVVRALLLGRALAGAQLLVGGRLMVSVLTRADFDAAGGDDTEGIVEMMRDVRGVEVAALIREQGPPGSWRASLRAGDGHVDVAAIAHAAGGGGHRAAAGLSSRRDPAELVAWLAERVGAALDG